MRNLWIFVNRYNAFFLFVIFFFIGIYLTVKNNYYQRSITISSTNELVGNALSNLNVVKKYIYLGTVNDSLTRENAKLKTELLAIQNIDTTKDILIKDTLGVPQYTYHSARVIKNSITNRNNFITINQGKLHGIAANMPVISPERGVVGFIQDVSDHFSTVRSLLNKNTFISVNVKRNNAVGSLIWGEGNFDFRKAYIQDIPNHFKIRLRDTVVTSGFSEFPTGIPVGLVTNTGISKGENFMTVEISLFNDFSNLQYVYVIKNKFAAEQKELEAQLPNEE